MQTRLISMIASFYLEGNHLSMRSAKGWWPNCVKVIPVWFPKDERQLSFLARTAKKMKGASTDMKTECTTTQHVPNRRQVMIPELELRLATHHTSVIAGGIRSFPRMTTIVKERLN
jgi:hypothetical protein